MLVDELDKTGGSRDGDARATPPRPLEPGSARDRLGPCLIAACGLAQASRIVAVNRADRLPSPLRNRSRQAPVSRPAGVHAETARAGLESELRAVLARPAGHELPIAPGGWRLLVRRLARSWDLRGARGAAARRVPHR
jgi:hypothetical protein